MANEKIKIYQVQQAYRKNKDSTVFNELIKEFYDEKLYKFCIELCDIAIENSTEKIGEVSAKMQFYYDHLIASYIWLNEMEIANNLYGEYVYFNKTLESKYFDYKTIFKVYNKKIIEEAKKIRNQ